MILSNQKVKRVRPLLGTFVSIELHGEAEEQVLQEAISVGFEAISHIDHLMSYHRANSELSRLNAAAPYEWIELDPKVCDVLEISNELFCDSDGIFDIRCGGILAEAGILPGQYSNQTFSKTVPVYIKGQRVMKTGNWILDLGGIAKGYAVDHAVYKIQDVLPKDITSGVVNAGGDMVIWGEESQTLAAKIAGSAGSWLQPFNIKQMAVATSSVRTASSIHLAPAAHVLMPERTFLTEPKTVTVLAERCLIADALTKIVLLASPETAKRCLIKYRAKALIFRPDGTFEKIVE
jgi:thiamine biosynthesis lipoprotein